MFFDQKNETLQMNEKRRQICLSITKKMMEYPCAKCFLEPVDPSEKEYLEIIQSPQDLTSILSRLENNLYETVDAWEQDVNLIWYNAEKFNGSDSYIFILASQLAKRFNKLIKEIDIERIECWMKYFYDLEAHLDTLMKSSPPKTKEYFPVDVENDDTDQKFTENDLSALDKALKNLTKPSDLLYFNNVLKRYVPIVDINAEPVSVDIRDLPNKTLRLLKDYAVKRHKEIGKPYPTK